MAFGSGGAAFGASSSSLFGSSFTQPSNNLFASNPPTNTFGNTNNNNTFGQSIPATNTLWSTPSQPTQPVPPQGSRAAPYQISHLHDSSNTSDPGKYLSISAMDPFRNCSVEELRLADYARGDKGADDQPASISGPASLGQTPAFSQSTSAFAPPSSAFGAQTPSLFAQSTPAFASAFGASTSAFGGPAPPAFAPTNTNPAFATSNTNTFGAAAPSVFAASSSAFGAGNSTPAFGSAPNIPFGAAPSSAFGGAAQSGGFASFGASSAAFGSSSFGATSSAPSLFGGATAQSTGGLFGGGQSQGGLFGASSSALGSTGAFGAPFAGATAPQSTPSLFGGSSFGTFGGAASSGASLFGNIGGAGAGAGNLFAGQGSGLFGNAPSSGGMFAANNGPSLFGTGSGFTSGLGSLAFNSAQNNAQQPQQQAGPLEASLTNNPFGTSKLFSGAATNAQSAPNGIGASVVNTGMTATPSQGKAVSVVVNPPQAYRRTRTSNLLARQTVMRRSSPATGWFAASPMRPWGENGSVFNVGMALRGSNDGQISFGKSRGMKDSITPWRTEEQIAKAANLKRLVIEPVQGDTVKKRPTSTQRTGAPRIGDDPFHGAIAGEELDVNVVTPVTRPWNTHTASGRPSPSGEVAADAAEVETPETSAPSIPLAATEERPENDAPGDTNSHGRAAEDEDALRTPAAVSNQRDEPNSSRRASPSPNNPASGGTGVKLAQYTPYSEFYKKTMSASRARPTIGSGDRRLSRRGSVDTPISTDPEYYMSPSLNVLCGMSRNELANVEEFSIGRKGMGEILWLEPVDLRGVNLDRVVEIKHREVSVYPSEDDLPPPGTGLNKPARVKLFGVFRHNKRTKEPLKDASTAARMVQKLKLHSEKEGLTFLGYDIKTGTWTFQTEKF